MDEGPGTITGTVCDASGNPIAGAFVREDWGVEGTSDDQGRYRLDGVWLGGGVLAVAAPGYLPIQVRVLVEEGAPTIHDAVLQTGGGKIAGQVTDPAGDPLRGITVDFYHSDFEHLSSRFTTAITDGDGRFRFSGVPPGRCSVSAHDRFRQWRTAQSQDAMAGWTDLCFSLEGAGVIEVRLVSANLNVLDIDDCGGVLVVTLLGPRGYEHGREIRTAEFPLEHLEPGQYSVQVRVPGIGSGQVSPVVVRAGEITSVPVPLDSAGHVLTGRVLAEEDQSPIEGAFVVALEVTMPINSLLRRGEQGEYSAEFRGVSTRTDSQGAFEVTGLTAGPHRLAFHYPGRIPAMKDPVLVPDSSIHRALLGRAGLLRVTVVLSSGEQIRDLNVLDVNLRYPNGCEADMADLPAGVAEYDHLPTGIYQAMVQARGCRLRAQILVREGQTSDLLLRVPDLDASLRGRLMVTSTAILPYRVQAGWESDGVRISTDVTPEEDGSFEFTALPAGPVELRLDYGSERLRKVKGVRVVVQDVDSPLELPIEVVELSLVDAETGDSVYLPGRTSSMLEVIGTPGELAELTLSTHDYHPTRLLSPSRDEVIEVRLRRAMHIWIDVKGPDHRSLPGASVQVADADGWDLTTPARQRNSSKPPFSSVSGFSLEPGQYLVRVEHPEFEPHEEAIAVLQDRTTFEIRVTASRAGLEAE